MTPRFGHDPVLTICVPSQCAAVAAPDYLMLLLADLGDDAVTQVLHNLQPLQLLRMHFVCKYLQELVRASGRTVFCHNTRLVQLQLAGDDKYEVTSFLPVYEPSPISLALPVIASALIKLDVAETLGFRMYDALCGDVSQSDVIEKMLRKIVVDRKTCGLQRGTIAKIRALCATPHAATPSSKPVVMKTSKVRRLYSRRAIFPRMVNL